MTFKVAFKISYQDSPNPLLSLQPGVTRTGFVKGGRSDQSNITLDGVDVNEQQSGLDVVTNQAFSSVLRILRDATQEFRVVTTNPNADTGRSSGAQVSLVTKSGTNDWHGSLFHFHRNTVTTANDFFNNKAGRFLPTDPQVRSGTATAGEPRLPRPPLLRNFFGGSVGGPVRKDRAFFFFAYEGFREATSSGGLQVVPLPHVGQGIIRYRTASGASDPSCPAGTPSGFRCLNANQINQAYLAANGITPGMNQAALNFLRDKTQRYVANDTTVGDGINTGGFRFNAPTPTTYDTYLLKLGCNLTDRSADRTFATQEYEPYWQDQWRMRHNLTLTYGLRWGTSTPVYEANGFQTQPTTSLGEYFEKRKAGSRRRSLQRCNLARPFRRSEWPSRFLPRELEQLRAGRRCRMAARSSG